MSERKAITPKTKVLALLDAAFSQDHPIRCRLCGLSIYPVEDIDWDHVWPVALGGPQNDWRNIRAVHRACHRKKTSGTKATSAGSDIHKIAKAKRIAKGKMEVRKPMDHADEALLNIEGAKQYKRAFPKGRKMQSRTFQKVSER